MASPADQEARAGDHYHDDDPYAHSPFQSQGPDPADGPLRSIPTFVPEDKDEHGASGHAAGSNGDSPGATASPPPGFLDKTMQKLGLNPLILMNMFKYVLSPRPRVFLLCYANAG